MDSTEARSACLYRGLDCHRQDAAPSWCCRSTSRRFV